MECREKEKSYAPGRWSAPRALPAGWCPLPDCSLTGSWYLSISILVPTSLVLIDCWTHSWLCVAYFSHRCSVLHARRWAEHSPPLLCPLHLAAQGLACAKFRQQCQASSPNYAHIVMREESWLPVSHKPLPRPGLGSGCVIHLPPAKHFFERYTMLPHLSQAHDGL